MSLPADFTLSTPRLRLRQPRLTDLPAIFSATRYPGFNDGMLWDPPASKEELIEPFHRSIAAWQKGEAFSFTIVYPEADELLGRISIRPTDEAGVWNIGFWTHPAVQGQGIISEAIAVILEFGFIQLGARRIEACHALWNKASERVLQKNGLQFVHHIEKGFQKKGEWVAENLLAIDRSDWSEG